MNDRFLAGITYGLTAIVFAPLTIWLARQTAGHDQLLHAFIVLAFTGVLFVFRRRLSLRPLWEFSKSCQNLLILAYLLLFFSWYTHISWLFLLAFCSALTSFLLFMFGDARRRIVHSLMGAFALFVSFVMLLPIFDWPLRALAGQFASASLQWIGATTQLGLVNPDGSEPMLLLISDGKPFHVAAECNGFGLLTSSLLMALLIVLYRRIPTYQRIGYLMIAAVLGFAFNTIRIVIIILLAPRVGEHYMLMHEIVGTASTYTALGLLFVLLDRRKSST